MCSYIGWPVLGLGLLFAVPVCATFLSFGSCLFPPSILSSLLSLFPQILHCHSCVFLYSSCADCWWLLYPYCLWPFPARSVKEKFCFCPSPYSEVCWLLGNHMGLRWGWGCCWCLKGPGAFLKQEKVVLHTYVIPRMQRHLSHSVPIWNTTDLPNPL